MLTSKKRKEDNLKNKWKTTSNKEKMEDDHKYNLKKINLNWL